MPRNNKRYKNTTNPQNRGRGWFNDKPQHKMASLGIETSIDERDVPYVSTEHPEDEYEHYTNVYQKTKLPNDKILEYWIIDVIPTDLGKEHKKFAVIRKSNDDEILKEWKSEVVDRNKNLSYKIEDKMDKMIDEEGHNLQNAKPSKYRNVWK